MRHLRLFFASALILALSPAWAAGPAPDRDTAKAVPPAAAVAPIPVDTLKAPPVVVDSAKHMFDTTAAAPAVPSPVAEVPDTAAQAAVAPSLPPSAPDPKARALFPDYPLVARQYVFGVVGQTVAGALGFYIGSAIETAIEGEDKAHKGTLSFTGIRYDNFYGAFYGGAIGGLFGSSLATYFTGQSDEQDGGYFWTLVGTGLAGAGAMYVASLMGVNDEVDWKPFLPLLAIPSAGGAVGFGVSRWFSDRKRERVMGPDAGITVHPPRLAIGLVPGAEGVHLQALNLSF